jgi:hypothetical protein
MYSTRSIFSRIVLIAALSLLSFSVFADTIRLKDGSIIKGKIVRFAGGTFSVDIGEGARKRQMTFSTSEVESIQFDSPQIPAVAARSNQYPVKSDTIIKVSTGTQSPSGNASSSPRVVTTDSIPVVKTPSSTPNIITPAPKTTSTNTQPKANIPTTGSGAQPVELSVKVLADNTANGWTNSGWVVRKGQRIRITGDGEISLGNGKRSTAAGLPDLPDDQKLLKGVATGALVAVIGDDNNDFIYIGAEREFTASRDGMLFLGVNEGNLNDNSGSFDVKIQIVPVGN